MSAPGRLSGGRRAALRKALPGLAVLALLPLAVLGGTAVHLATTSRSIRLGGWAATGPRCDDLIFVPYTAPDGQRRLDIQYKGAPPAAAKPTLAGTHSMSWSNPAEARAKLTGTPPGNIRWQWNGYMITGP